MWQSPQNSNSLRIRAKMVFMNEQDRYDVVQRCPNHIAQDRIRNPDEEKHIIKCLNRNSHYIQDRDGFLSVIIPGDEGDLVQNISVDIAFFCKNSCSTLKRRATKVIFTLETEENQILGRHVLQVRICCSPKRDLEKEESQDAIKSSNIVKGEKSKIVESDNETEQSEANELGIGVFDGETFDSNIYDLHISVVGIENAQAVLRHARDILAGAARRSNKPELYNSHIENIEQRLLP